MNGASSPRASRERVYELVEAALCDDIAHEDAMLLDGLVAHDPEARRYYLEYLSQSLALRSWAATEHHSSRPLLHRAGESSRVPGLRSPPLLSRVTTRSLVAAAAVLFVALTVLALVPRYRQVLTESLPVGADVASAASGVARIVALHECEWGQRPLRGGELLAGDVLDLRSGLAEIRFSSGATVILEGPVHFTCDQANSGTLTHGKLAARIDEPRAKGFTVQTPHASIVDLGTEFAVEVDDDGGADVHVFEGTVEAVRGDRSDPAGRQTIRRGQARRIESASVVIQSIQFDSARFVRSLPTGPTVPSRFDLGISEEYVAAVRAARPAAYWRFESIEARRVRDETGRYDLVASGPLAVRGSQANRVGTFMSHAELATQRPVAGLDEHGYSIELWFQPASKDHASLVWLTTETQPSVWSSTACLEVLSDAERFGTPLSIRGLHRWPPGGSIEAGTDVRHGVPDDGWQHVVLVKTASHLRLFWQGKRVAQSPDTTVIGADRCHVSIGSHKKTRWFRGEIDEVAIYPRALSTAEIEEHYHLVKQRAQREPGSDAELE